MKENSNQNKKERKDVTLSVLISDTNLNYISEAETDG